MSNEKSMGVTMYVPREAILDLLPLYAAGEATAETRAMVDAYLELDETLRQEVERDGLGVTPDLLPPSPGPSAETELRSLRRAQGLLRWQRRLYSWALVFTVVSLGGVGWIQNGKFSFHFFLSDYPQYFYPCVSIAVSCWINYFIFFVLRRRLRSPSQKV
jgi:hypothetical protein